MILLRPNPIDDLCRSTELGTECGEIIAACVGTLHRGGVGLQNGLVEETICGLPLPTTIAVAIAICLAVGIAGDHSVRLHSCCHGIPFRPLALGLVV